MSLKKELSRFLVAGISAVGTDLITYYLLLFILEPSISKAISFILGTIVAFTINKYWTFEKHKKSYKEIFSFMSLYTITLGVNVFVNDIVLEYSEIIILAFFVATGFSTVLNFIGQKWWVFR
ncbi:MAG: Arabinogalactan biosynthesis recruiting protein [uncultured Campylobacterales bacterium]|uniref:Arabinogalactan biosynthesis recruiting protein n=1 Tax=uncultured Campylobacterales bacterium TaxID=352960 RepID=A0A6S6TGV9_9BACT|nr:MAG: Arabinogalactan biosynthesis recruiting protein [uncultured Campylobacterales bacterium]